MAHSPNLHKRFFPSYNQIHQTILSHHKKQHQKKITELQRKIHNMQQVFNLDQEHEQIKQRLLENYNSSNHHYLKNVVQSLNDREERLEKQKQSYLWNARSSNYGNSSSNAYSLNYCIDDDMEDDNHYQNHLKFKKQVLERDLFENVNDRPDRKKQHDEEYIFKNLYNPRPATALQLGLKNSLKVRKPLKKNYLTSQNTKEFKENIKQFRKDRPSKSKNKMDLNCWKSPSKHKQNDRLKKKEMESSMMKKCLRKESNNDEFTQQHEVCQKNTKILKDSYGKYLKELSGTNIIKWRVLGGEKEKEKNLNRMSLNGSGIGVSSIGQSKEEQVPAIMFNFRNHPDGIKEPKNIQQK